MLESGNTGIRCLKAKNQTSPLFMLNQWKPERMETFYDSATFLVTSQRGMLVLKLSHWRTRCLSTRGWCTALFWDQQTTGDTFCAKYSEQLINLGVSGEHRPSGDLQGKTYAHQVKGNRNNKTFLQRLRCILWVITLHSTISYYKMRFYTRKTELEAATCKFPRKLWS